MNVAELAKDLGVPASAIIEQCQRFGIDASWAGADLSSSDVVVLRAELALDDGLLDLTGHGEAEPANEATPAPSPAAPADAAPTPEARPEPTSAGPAPEMPASSSPAAPPAAGAEPAPALPPTAVGSLPDLADELAVTGDDEPAHSGALRSGAALTVPSVASAGPAIGRTPAATGANARTVRFDRGVGRAATFLVVAAAAVAGAIVLATPWAVSLLWLVAVVFVALALLDANRARAHSSLHPERVRGRALSYGLLAVGLAFALALGTTAWVVVRTEPATDAPAGIGDLAAVKGARWGYHRVLFVKDNGWHSSAKEAGTCWIDDPKEDARQEGRSEAGNEQIDCDGAHTVEVLRTWAVNRDIDAPYPGAAPLSAIGTKRCADDLAAANAPQGTGGSAQAVLVIEQPDEGSWADGDHDLSCVAVTAERSGPLPD